MKANPSKRRRAGALDVAERVFYSALEGRRTLALRRHGWEFDIAQRAIPHFDTAESRFRNYPVVIRRRRDAGERALWAETFSGPHRGQ